MKVKNIYILVGLVLVIGIAGIYVYAQNTWLLPPPDFGPPNKDFPAQIEICNGLTQGECLTNDNCLGRFGPSSCSGNMCTADLVFKSCGPSGLNSDEIQQIRSECNEINGEFGKDSLGGTFDCLCTKPDYIGKDRCLEDLINQLSTN